MTTSPYTIIPRITVPDLLIKYLKLEGVDHLFGIPGASFVDLLEALKNDRESMTYVICKHETGAGFMADGYHRVSRRMGVVLVTSGPGATNALTGAMNAEASFSSMMVLTGEQPQAKDGLGWEQEGVDLTLDVRQVYKSAVRYSVEVNAAPDFDVLLRQALRDAQGIPGQAVHLSLPRDITGATLTDVRFPTKTSLYRSSIDSAAPADVQRVGELLVAAKRPMILLGNGSRVPLSHRLAEFLAFVERLGVPVGTTADAKGLFPESHLLALRSCGHPPCQWPGLYYTPPKNAKHAAPYDFLLVLGSSMGDFATNIWDPKMVPDGAFVQVDASPGVIGRSMPITMGVMAEIGAFLGGLFALDLPMDVEAKAERLAYLEWMKENYSPYADPKARESDATPIRPERAMAIVSDMLPPGSHIFPDAGNSCGWTAHYLEIDPPTQVHATLDVGAMGYGTAAVVGGKLAAPDATCLCIGGDGSFMMHGMEVSTAAQYSAGAIWLVWSEDDLNMVAQGMNYLFPDPAWKDYYKLGNPDLVKVAQGLGAAAYLVRSPSDLEEALESAIRGGQEGKPQVIVVKEDPSAMPPFYPKRAGKT